jgi:GT2 family glycosyltransferase
MTRINVSIIIVSWNTRDILRDCLQSVYNQTRRASFEVIVIDNASEDGSRDMVRREFSNVSLIANEQNLGFAAANNQGIRAARGRYVLLLNSDTRVLDGAIDTMVDFADAHPEAAAVACRVVNPDETWQPTCFMFPSALNTLIAALYLNRLFPRNRFFGRERMTWWDGQDVRAVDVVAGCFILASREIIKQIGALDESYFMYGEESDWCYRLHKAGWKVLYAPIAQVVHYGGVSSAQIKGPMCLQLRASTLLFLKKHTSPLSYVAACGFVSLFFLLRLPLWLAKAVASRKANSEDWQTVRIYAAGFWHSLHGWRALCAKRGASHAWPRR